MISRFTGSSRAASTAAWLRPRRFGTAFVWYSRRIGGVRGARVALALGRPVPESLREAHFLRLHWKAERAYEPEPYGGDLLIFSGENLYEGPELGWSGLARGD